MTVVTFFQDHKAQSKQEISIEPDQLGELIKGTAAPAKASLPWLKFARFGNDRSTQGNSLRHDRNRMRMATRASRRQQNQ